MRRCSASPKPNILPISINRLFPKEPLYYRHVTIKWELPPHMGPGEALKLGRWVLRGDFQPEIEYFVQIVQEKGHRNKE